jgi:hypothetical protein
MKKSCSLHKYNNEEKGKGGGTDVHKKTGPKEKSPQNLRPNHDDADKIAVRHERFQRKAEDAPMVVHIHHLDSPTET